MSNKSKGAIYLFAGVFLIMLGLTLTSTDNTGFGISCIITAIVLSLIGIYHLTNNETFSFTNEQKQDIAALNRAVDEMYKSIKDLTDAYMLNIPDEAIKKLIFSDNRFTDFARYIPTSYPNVPAFCFNMITKCEELINKMQLPVAVSTPLYEHCLQAIGEMSTVLTDQDIIDLAEDYAKELPPELFCLHTQINYETSALGIIGDYALSKADSYLIGKINEYRRSRGFIK
jgi:hypothetical protein